MAYTKGDGNATKRYIIPLNDGKDFVTVNSKGARCQKPSEPTFGTSGARQPGGGSGMTWGEGLIVGIGTLIVGPILVLTTAAMSWLLFPTIAAAALGSQLGAGMTEVSEMQEPVFCDPHAGQF